MALFMEVLFLKHLRNSCVAIATKFDISTSQKKILKIIHKYQQINEWHQFCFKA